jgi:hypothetical protein
VNSVGHLLLPFFVEDEHVRMIARAEHHLEHTRETALGC